MQYQGKLYGHFGGKKYFDTGKTADDWDALEKRVAELEADPEIKLIYDWVKELSDAGYTREDIVAIFKETKRKYDDYKNRKSLKK